MSYISSLPALFSLNFKSFMKKNKATAILTTKQMAEYLQMDEATVYRLSRKRKIPGIKILGQWRFL